MNETEKITNKNNDRESLQKQAVHPVQFFEAQSWQGIQGVPLVAQVGYLSGTSGTTKKTFWKFSERFFRWAVRSFFELSLSCL